MTVTASGPTGRKLAAPTAVFAAVAAATAYVGAVSPDRPGHYPVCPLLRITGLWCPACGGLRCVHALTRGDLVTALNDNALVVLAGGFAVLAWLRWGYWSWRGLPVPPVRIGRGWAWAAGLLAVAFTVLRNTPWGGWLAPPSVPL